MPAHEVIAAPIDKLVADARLDTPSRRPKQPIQSLGDDGGRATPTFHLLRRTCRGSIEGCWSLEDP
jgi:hypothetical protein